MRHYWILPIAVLALAALACQAVLPTQTPPSPGTVLFYDEFSDPSSGWSRVNATNGATDYTDGMYRIFVNEQDVDIWAKPGLDFTNVRVDVDVLKVGGERNNRFGVLCRAVALDSFYTFIISSDGYYGIGKIKGQEHRLLGMDALQVSDAIQVGSAVNHIRADCVGDTLTLYVNGVKLHQAKDSEFASGDVGLITGAYEAPGVDIRFDNFVVYQP
jgi:hypothetical protein